MIRITRLSMTVDSEKLAEENRLAAEEQRRQLELLLSVRLAPRAYPKIPEAAWFSCPGCQESFLVEGLTQCPDCGCSLLRELDL